MASVDTPNNELDLHEVFTTRRSDPLTARRHALQNEMVNVYYNEFTEPGYVQLFEEHGIQHKPNPIRRSWDDLTMLASKEFPVTAPNWKGTKEAAEIGEKLEKVAYHWHNNARMIQRGVTMKALTQYLCWWLIGCAQAVFQVQPDHRTKSLFYTHRDPRTYYPPPGYTPWGPTPLNNVLFAYQMTLGELKRRYGDEGRRKIDAAYATKYPSQTSNGEADDKTVLNVGEWWADDAWIVSTLDDPPISFVVSQAGVDKGHPGVCNVIECALYAPNGVRPFYADDVSIQAGLVRVLSMVLEYAEQILYGPIVTTGFEHKDFRSGPLGVNVLAKDVPNPRADRLSPASDIGGERMLGMLMTLLRSDTRSNEAMRGEGEMVSSRARESALEVPTRFIEQGIWGALIEKFPRAYAISAITEINLWPEEKKSIGVVALHPANPAKSVNTHLTYIPTRDLRGHEYDLIIKPDLGLATYQDEISVQQRLSSKSIPRRYALDRFPDISDSLEAERLIQLDEIGDLTMAAAGQGVASGMIPLAAMAEVAKRVREGEDRMDVILDLAQKGKLSMTPPQPEPAAPPLEALLAGAGGGQPALPAGPPPSLAAMGGV